MGPAISTANKTIIRNMSPGNSRSTRAFRNRRVGP